MEIAREMSIPVLNGLEVLRHLPGEMPPEAEEVLGEEATHILAAREDKTGLSDQKNPALLRRVPAEELLYEDVDERLLGVLEDLTQDPPTLFLVPPTERVLTFLARQGEHSGSPLD